MTREKLIAALEAATTEGSELLDCHIYALTAPDASAFPVREWHPNYRSQVPRYTRSLDAALTLVPSRFFWAVGAGRLSPAEPLYGATVSTAAPNGCCGAEIGAAEHHHSAPVALCIAALKARAAEPETGA